MAIDTTYLDSGADKIKLARPALLAAVQALNDMETAAGPGTLAEALLYVTKKSSQPANAWAMLVAPYTTSDTAGYIDNVLTIQNLSRNGSNQYGNAAIRFRDGVTGYERAAIGYSGSGDAATAFYENTAYIEIGNLSPDAEDTIFRMIATFAPGNTSYGGTLYQYWPMEVNPTTGNITFDCPAGKASDFTIKAEVAVGVPGAPRMFRSAGLNTYLRIRERDADNHFAFTTNVDTGTTKDNSAIPAWRIDYGGLDFFRIGRAAVGSTTWVDFFKISPGGTIKIGLPLEYPAYAVSALPNAATPYQRAFATDANATTFNSVVAGGGSNKVPVFSDGSVWRIG